MEKLENSTLENQMRNEDMTVQRNKELFEYEMTEVKLMLAGRFKHISAADMQNAGADVVIREPNLQLKDHNLFTDNEVTFHHPQIAAVDASQLHISEIEIVDQDISGITIEEAKKITRAKCDLHDVGISYSSDSAKETKVHFIHPQVRIGLEDITLPRTARIDIDKNEIDIPKVSNFNSKSGDRKLTYTKKDPVVELEIQQVGHIKTADVAIAELDTSISITRIDRPFNLKKNPAHVELKKPVMLDEIKMKGLSSVKIKPDDTDVSDITIGSQKKAEFHPLESPPQVEINMVTTPIIGHLLPIQNDNYSSQTKLIEAKLIEDLSIAESTIKFTPVKHTVKCKCELPGYASSINRPSVNRSPVTILLDNNMCLKNFVKHRENSEVDVSDAGNLRIPKNRKLQKESVDYGDMIIDPIHLPDATLKEYKSTVEYDGVEINRNSIGAIIPKKCYVGKICVDGDSVNTTKISIKEKKAPANINKPQVETAKMKITPIAPVSDIIDKVQTVSRGILPKGLSYEEMCRRCVVPVRKLDYQPAFEEILGTLKAELNS